MSEASVTADDLQEFLHPVPPSRDPAYLAWAESRVKRALEDDLAAPDDAVPQHEVWKRFGFEY